MEQQEFIKPKLHISVRNLVEFVLRNGDIDDRRSGKNPLSAMQEGRKIHQKIQGKMKSNYHPEVPLSFCISYDDYDLMIEGRADGIIYDDVLSKESSVILLLNSCQNNKRNDEPRKQNDQTGCYKCAFFTE